jgi:galactokinase
MSSFVPKHESLEEFYPTSTVKVQEGRWERLKDEFEKIFEERPTFIARSPGRVNLIGEAWLPTSSC